MNSFEMQTVLDILEAEDGGLLKLAERSRRDPLSFYRSCDLRGLNLSGQNLEGLNFDFANLTSSILDGARFDIGALNNALVDEKYLTMKDEYDCYIEDLSFLQIQSLSAYAKFRKEIIDEIMVRLRIRGYKYASLSHLFGISTSTFRKIRSQVPVAITTAVLFADGIGKLKREIGADFLSEIDSKMRQPFLALSDYGSGQNERRVSRRELLDLLDLMSQLNGVMYPHLAENGKMLPWSAKPATLRWMKKYYIDGRFHAYNAEELLEASRNEGVFSPDYVATKLAQG